MTKWKREIEVLEAYRADRYMQPSLRRGQFNMVNLEVLFSSITCKEEQELIYNS